ncbi:hypothetical protein GCM10010293_36830 [Streptomyces griseoflavus]|uniref:hypothetical protein n=1 Tax=Streptomyces griseoflavus TaxID=35619 RepID=UPI00167F0A6A|nr:hypothetical protein [Streptomyces griseoflavus]GGV34367.1 hypothetical protein GCM10010293_36830 [Streptomyces griseoflavus]
MAREQTPEQKVTALSLAALRADGEGLALLLNELPDDEVRNACGYALMSLCNGFRAILTAEAWQEVIGGVQAHAAELAHDS